MSHIKVPIEPHFAGGYELNYDGKYLTLMGKDNRYEVPCSMSGLIPDEPEYETMVLVSCVIEKRGIAPEIIDITLNHIIIELNELRND